MNERRFRTMAVVLVTGTVILPLQAEAQGASEASGNRVRYGAYCGIHCVYGALSSLGKNIVFESLLELKYLGSRQGSTIMELKAAVEDSGGHAVALAGLGPASLRAAQYPMILHVASEGQLEEYDHWVLFLGVVDGKARIVDAPDPPGLLSMGDLLARWDGAALVVSDKEVQAGSLIWADRGTFLLWGLLAFGLIYGAHITKSWLARGRPTGRFGRLLPGPVVQGACLLVPAMVLAGLLHAVDAQGFLRNPGAREYVAASNALSFFPKLSLDEARQLATRDGIQFIDARYRPDFEKGHIPGAINVPINAGVAERERILIGISRDRPVVLYCQSQGCRFDDKMAVLLAGHGFDDISLFPGGWLEWKETQEDSGSKDAE